MSEYSLPSCPSVFVGDQTDISAHIPESARAALRCNVIHSPATGTEFWGVTPSLSVGQRLQRRLTLPPSYEEAVPAYRFLRVLQEWNKVLNRVIFVLSIVGDILCARLFMRWARLLGDSFVTETDSWLTLRTMVLFWIMDICLFQKMGGSRFTWMVGLWLRNSWPSCNSIWIASFLDLIFCIILYSAGGVLRLVAMAANNAAR